MNIEQTSGGTLDVTATFQLTPKEMRGAVRRLPVVRRMLLLSPLILLLGLVISWSDGTPKWYLLVFGVVLPLVTELLIVRGAVRRSAPLLADPWTIRITERSYTLRTGVSESTVEWRLYREITTRDGFWYLHQLDRNVGFLPRRAFPEAERATLTAFFAHVLPPLPKPWYRPF